MEVCQETRLTRFARPYNGCNASVRPPQDRQRSVWAKRNTSGKTSPYRRFVNWNRIHGLRKLNHFVPELRALRTIEALHAFPRPRDQAFRVRTSEDRKRVVTDRGS